MSIAPTAILRLLRRCREILRVQTIRLPNEASTSVVRMSAWAGEGGLDRLCLLRL